MCHSSWFYSNLFFQIEKMFFYSSIPMVLREEVHICYDLIGAYMGINVYDIPPSGGIYRPKCTCNV
jgi:hypothetical protein